MKKIHAINHKKTYLLKVYFKQRTQHFNCIFNLKCMGIKKYIKHSSVETLEAFQQLSHGINNSECFTKCNSLRI